jgi:spore coat polysaccharide biosynthesis protein SpsF
VPFIVKKIFLIIQARMTSTRLPKKVVLPLCGKTVLEVMMERLAPFKDNIIIATTNDGTQQPIINICQKQHLKYYEGDTNNVLSRYYEAALAFGAKENDIIVRCTSDCPLIDKEIVQKTIDFFISSKADYTRNSGFPIGISAEVFRFSLLKEAYEKAQSDYEKEHVTPYMYISSKDKLKITTFKSEKDESNYRITLDEIDDYTAIQEIYNLFDCQTDFSYQELVNKLKGNPYIYDLNSHVVQKS